MSAIDDLIQALEAIKQKSDGTILYAAEVHDLVDGIFAAMEMAGDVTVTTTPIEGGNKITITDPEGVTHEFDVMNGADGEGAVTPFKGWYDSLAALQAAVGSPAVGDYAYIKGATASDPAAIYECTTAGTWSDSGRTVDTSNVQTFETGQAVNGTAIDNTGLGNPAGNALAKATDAMGLAAKLEGVTAREVKATNIQDWHPEGTTSGYYKSNGSWQTSNNYKSTRIDVGGYDSVRFLGFSYPNTLICYAFAKLDGTLCDTYPIKYDTTGDSFKLKEYKIKVPSDAKYLVCVYITNDSLNSSNFYCYLQSGESVVELINVVKDDLDVKTNIYQRLSAGFNLPSYYYIDANGYWRSTSPARSVFINVNPGDRIRLNNGTLNSSYAILQRPAYSLNNKAVFSESHQSLFGRSDFKTTDYVITIPEDGHILYKRTVLTSGNVDSTEDLIIPIKDKVVELENKSAGITHLLPDNLGQLNAVRRMRKLTDLKWTPAFNIPRLSYGGGKYFEDVFLPNKTYKGIPYARARKSMTSYGYDSNYTGFKIGIYISLETFITAIANKGTVVDKGSEYVFADKNASFFANVCSGSVCAALHMALKNSDEFYAVPSGFTSLGIVDSSFDLTLLKLGDVMATADGDHTVMVTDVIYDGETVKYVEVSESTVTGNENNNVLGTTQEGGLLGGVARRLWWSAEEFPVKWDGYKVIRYGNINALTYTPSPYIPMPDEYFGNAPYTMACLPYMGNKFRYVSGKITQTISKVVVTVKGKDKLHVIKDGADYGSLLDIPAFNTGTGEGEGYEYVYVSLPTDMQVGNYEAYACKIENDTETEKTKRCQWSVVDSITLLEDY